MGSVPRALSLLALLVALLCAGWFLTRARGERGSEPPVAGPEVLVSGAAPPAPESARLEIPVAPLAPEARAPEPIAKADKSEPPVPSVLGLVGEFQRPDRSQVRVDAARLLLSGAGREPRQVSLRNAETFLVEDLEPGPLRLEARVEGYTHVPIEFDVSVAGALSAHDRGELGPGPEHLVRRYVVLWPEGWLSVGVLDPEGRPIAALAEDLGYLRAELFSEAFRAVVRLDAPASDDVPWNSPSAGSFETVREHQLEHLSPACIGFVRSELRPPYWVGLSYLGHALGWQPVGPGDVEVLFVLDPEAVRGQFARLTLRVVEKGSGRPLPEAEVWLMAEVSPLRRGDGQQDVHPDADGRLVFEDVVPGEYDLVARTSSGSFAQRLVVVPGERDLGTIELAARGGIEVLVLDADNRPARARLETGPYEPGRLADELFTPRGEQTGSDGRATLPIPSHPTLLRARRWMILGGKLVGGAPATSVLLDPANLPQDTLVLHLVEDRQITFEPGPETLGADHLDLLDALGVVLQRMNPRDPNEMAPNLVPGDYVLRAYDGEGGVMWDAEFDVLAEPARVPLP